MQNKNLVIRIVMCMFAWLFCLQPSLAATEDASSGDWKYPTSRPDGKFSGGAGNSGNPYLIKTAQDLADLAWLVNDGEDFEGKNFKLVNDIVLNDITFDEDNLPTNKRKLKAWTSIGKQGMFFDDAFSGYFDGNDHSISGLYINVNDTYSYGLFGALDRATIWSLTIKDSFMDGASSSNYATGMLVGYMKESVIKYCHVENSHIDIYLSSKVRVGGIVGQGSGEGKKVVSSSFNGSITAHFQEGAAYVAGIMGLGAPDLINCQVSGLMKLVSFSQYGNDELNANGLCYEAGDITECVNNMNFVINTENKDGSRLRKINQHTLCCKVNNISRSANFGNIKVLSTNGWDGSAGNIGTAGTMNDCAFYGSVTSSAGKSTSGKIVYNYLGDDIKSFEKNNCNRNVFLDEGNYTFVSYNFERVDMKKNCADPNGGNLVTNIGDKRYISSDDLYAKLNEASTTWNIWGKIKGMSEDMLNGCPLPVACGGVLDAGFKGKGTKERPWLIGSEAELRELAEGINKGKMDNEDKYFALTADIDMTNSGAFDPIGNAEDHAFHGHFDGQGHVITGIKINDPGLFGYVGNGFSLKRLAVVDARLNITNSAYKVSGVLVGHSVADRNTTSVSDCYVGGDIHITANKWLRVGGLVGEFRDDISNCYFKGRFIVDSAGKPDTHELFGIAAFTQPNTLISSCYASFSVEAPSDMKFNYIYGICTGADNLQNCYSVCDDIIGSASERYNGKRCNNDSEIFAGYEFPADSPWTRGAFRPVLKDAKSYAATAADGSDTEAYYDAIPLRNDKDLTNDICHYTLKDGEEDDDLLWALPNLAIYNPADKSEYIINCTLDPAKPLNYSKKSSIDVEAVKVNMSYPLSLTSGKQYYPLCLPGTVKRSDFPFGSQLYIGGEVKTDNDGKRYMNIVQADSVAGGIPFVAYIPSAKTGDIINIVMRSRMAVEPLKSITDGKKTQRFSLTGTYKGQTVSNACTDIAEKGTMLYIDKVEGEQTLPPFTAWLDSEEKVELRNYLLLDEMSNDIAEAIADNDGKNVSTMLKRELTQDKWNTICLPTKLQSDYIDYRFGQGTKLEQLSSVETNPNGGYTLVFTYATDIEPGKSYLIKPASVNAVYNLSYCDISGQLTPSEVHFTTDGAAATVKLCGTFERKALSGDDSNEYYTLDDKVCRVAAGQEALLNGFHCYITADENAAKALAKGFVIRHADGSTTTGLRLVEVGTTADGKQRVYNLQGMEQNPGARQRGVYVKGGRKYVKQ